MTLENYFDSSSAHRYSPMSFQSSSRLQLGKMALGPKRWTFAVFVMSVVCVA